MQTEIVQINNPDSLNVIFGQSHFIKTVEDVHEAMVSAVPNIKFGMAFCEASGDKLVRSTGTDENLVKLAENNALKVACGHTFIIFLGNAFPINVLNQIKLIPEVVRIFAATANPLQVIVTATDQGRGVAGVIDGGSPVGIETPKDKKIRFQFLRKIGYKQ